MSAMEDWRVLDAVSLRAELDRSGPLTAARAVALIVQVAVELDGLAADGGLRSDIVDPVNILLAGDGSVSLAGPATAVESDVAYLAPERVARTGPVSAVTDVYALACVLWECLTGRPPQVDGAGVVADGGAVPVPPGFDAVLASGLAANPGDRLPSAGAFAVAARRALRDGDSGSADLSFVSPPVRQNQPEVPGLSSRVREVLSNPNVAFPTAVGYRSVTEKVPPISAGQRSWRAASIGQRLRWAAIAATVLLLIGMSIVVARNVVGIDGTATGPQSEDVHLTIRPESIAVDDAGNTYIAGMEWDYSNYRVWKLAPASTEVTKLPFPDDGMRPMGVAVDSAGRIYVTTLRRNVLVLAPDTGEVRKYPIHDQGDLADIAVDSIGNVVGVGSRSDAGRTSWWIWTLNTETSVVTRLPFPDSGDPYHVAIGPSGEVYAASGCLGIDGKFVETNWVWRLDVGATEPVKTPLGRGTCPRLLAVDPAGNLYVENYGTPSTLIMVPAGWAAGFTLPMRHLKQTYDFAADRVGNIYGVSADIYAGTATLEKLTIQP
ncbi:putative transmembrane serine/threonine-kinase H domain protein [Mycobacteroides abscessus 4S-0726-RB]|nr:putative transmembrane serine/threonine-kinase H domain protein [Mycobacteroides abscessus 4S-0303]EIT92265.1 putative transmembrane serine/threonine-kinase H domain protein [Mycobacteroides abscessus 4S-0726-RB]EIT95815.1 putative transmembrane serine/threonine-kinase H domain protein [Mycobacteroides abscessus 4S-0726-RA]EIV60247.1 putative transmembrane serine/threonine-kinase H domain protein [Mycobacteroides abscessus 4S-0116-S]